MAPNAQLAVVSIFGHLYSSTVGALLGFVPKIVQIAIGRVCRVCRKNKKKHFASIIFIVTLLRHTFLALQPMDPELLL